MKRYIVYVLLMMLIFSVGCSSDTAGTGSNVFRSISPSEAKDIMMKKSDLLVVDVRSPKELKSGYIDGSVFIPIWEIAQGRKSLPADRPLLLVCAIGGRSYGLGKYLNEKGWPEIYNLSGGIAAWKNAGLPLKY